MNFDSHAAEDKIIKLLEKNSYIDPALYTEHNVKHGLRNQNGTGVLVGITKVANVEGYDMVDGKKQAAPGRLYYRGYNLLDLVKGFRNDDRFGFEETMALLLLGNLPDSDYLDDFNHLIEKNREFPPHFTEDVILRNPSKNIMNMLQRAILNLYTYDESPEDTSLLNTLRECISIIAKMPLLMCYAYQAKVHYYSNNSLVIHKPLEGASTAENILHMLRPDGQYTQEEAKLLDLLLVVHAEHGGGNNSAFATHVVSSTGTDTYSAIATALGSLKGPKHGGANLMVKKMVDHIKKNCDYKNKEKLSAYIDRILKKEVFDQSGLVYGIGHAVYTKSDPRCVLLKESARQLASVKNLEEEFEFLSNIEKLTIEKIKARHKEEFYICANVDLYSGFVYEMLGINEDLYTPMFAIARVAGWSAHRLEQVTDRKIMRPGYVNVVEKRNYIDLTHR